MHNLDEESKQFIKWCEEKFKDDTYMYDFFEEIVKMAKYFYNNSPYEILRTDVLEKMIEGAREHKAPKKDISIIEGEIRKEMLDLVGWGLMLKYREEGN